MSTRGVIARQINNREVEYLYSHWDNYLEYNGAILQEHYNTKEKVDELFAKNRGVSSLAKSVEKTNFYEEEGEAIKRCPLNFLNTRADGCWAEYIYVFTLKGEWKYREIWSIPKDNGEWAFGWSRFKSLAKAVEKTLQNNQSA